MGAAKTTRYWYAAGPAIGCTTNYEVYFTGYTGVCDSAKHGAFLTCAGNSGGISTSLFDNYVDDGAAFYRKSPNSIYFYTYTTDNDLEGTYTFSVTVTNDWTAVDSSRIVSFSGATVRIIPDCSLESISAPSISLQDMQYTIYAETLVYVFDGFTVSRASCPVVSYSLKVNTLDPTDEDKVDTEDRFIVTFDSDTRSISVHSENNLFGDKEIEMVLTAYNSGSFVHSETFKLFTTKDC